MRTMSSIERGRTLRAAAGLSVLVLTGLVACKDPPTGPAATAAPIPTSASVAKNVRIIDLGVPGLATAIASNGNFAGAVNAGAGTHAASWHGAMLSDLGTLGGDVAYGQGISSRGDVVGWSLTADGRRVAVLWEDGTPTLLPATDASYSMAFAIGQGGDIVGVDGQHAALWRNGQVIDLGTLGGATSAASAIGKGGEIVGFSLRASGPGHAFLWASGTMTDLGALSGDYSIAYGINSKGQIVGASTTANGQTRPVLWDNGVMIDLGSLGGEWYGIARDVNAKGQIVGVASTGDGHQHGFLWENGVMTDLGTLGGLMSSAYAINEFGQITGWATMQGEAQHAVFWSLK